MFESPDTKSEKIRGDDFVMPSPRRLSSVSEKVSEVFIPPSDSESRKVDVVATATEYYDISDAFDDDRLEPADNVIISSLSDDSLSSAQSIEEVNRSVDHCAEQNLHNFTSPNNSPIDEQVQVPILQSRQQTPRDIISNSVFHSTVNTPTLPLLQRSRHLF